MRISLFLRTTKDIVNASCGSRSDCCMCLWAKPKPILQAKRARVKGNKSFYSCSCFFFCRYIHFREICSRKMNSICSRFARTRYIRVLRNIFSKSANRYEINPSFAQQTYRVHQHISSLYISPLARYANHIENPARDLSRCVILR